MSLDQLYTAYGQQTMQFKILQSQLQQTEKAIIDAINAQNAATAPAVPEVPKEGE